MLLKLLVLNMVAFTATADEPTISPSSWEKFPHGIAVTVTLNGRVVAAYVKNTSSSPLKIVGDDRHLVRFFYIDSNHARIPVRDKSEADVYATRKASGSAIIPQEGAPPFRLQIELTPDELTAIKTNPAACRFTIFDPTVQKYFTLESTPRLLTSGP